LLTVSVAGGDVLSLFAQVTLSNHIMEMLKTVEGLDIRLWYEGAYEEAADDFDQRLPSVLERLEAWLAKRA